MRHFRVRPSIAVLAVIVVLLILAFVPIVIPERGRADLRVRLIRLSSTVRLAYFETQHIQGSIDAEILIERSGGRLSLAFDDQLRTDWLGDLTVYVDRTGSIELVVGYLRVDEYGISNLGVIGRIDEEGEFTVKRTIFERVREAEQQATGTPINLIVLDWINQ